MQLGWNLVCSAGPVWLRGNHEQRLLCALERGGGLANPSWPDPYTFRSTGKPAVCARKQPTDQLASVPTWGDGWVANRTAAFDPLTLGA